MLLVFHFKRRVFPGMEMCNTHSIDNLPITNMGVHSIVSVTFKPSAQVVPVTPP